jgi:phosphoribosyl 1,2-cyclic phosphodiesterase
MIPIDDRIRVRLRGVRGSYPVPGPRTLRIGGNTTCHEIRAGGHLFVFDAGTGIIPLGDELAAQHRADGQPLTIHLFFTHVHHDHVYGFLFFKPAYFKSTRLRIYGPKTFAGTIHESLSELSASSFHPVGVDEMGAQMQFVDLVGGEILRYRAEAMAPEIVRLRDTFSMGRGDAVVRVVANPNHTKLGVLHYRLDYAGKSYVFATDVEGTEEGEPTISALAAEADVLAHDAQYTDHDYYHETPPRKGWGHSTFKMACATARKARVRQLVLIHHDPDRDDAAVEAFESEAKALFPSTAAGREGMIIEI